MKRMTFAGILSVLDRESPGPEGSQKFKAMLQAGAFYDVNAEPERFEAPLAGGGTIAFQLVRQVNKELKESKQAIAFTVARSEFSVEYVAGKRHIIASDLKAEHAFASKAEAESYLNRQAYILCEPDMVLGVINNAGELQSMCYNDKKIIVLAVLSSLQLVGLVINAPDLSLQGPLFKKVYFMSG